MNLKQILQIKFKTGKRNTNQFENICLKRIEPLCETSNHGPATRIASRTLHLEDETIPSWRTNKEEEAWFIQQAKKLPSTGV